MQSAPTIFRAAKKRRGRSPYEQRRKVDKRSIGELFYVSCDELQDLQYMDALIMVLKKLVSMITEKWLFLEKELNAMPNT